MYGSPAEEIDIDNMTCNCCDKKVFASTKIYPGRTYNSVLARTRRDDYFEYSMAVSTKMIGHMQGMRSPLSPVDRASLLNTERIIIEQSKVC